MISVIVAVDKHNGIGYQNKLPWYYKEDLAYFKRVTNNSTIVMGRKTFDSIGRPLPNRINVIVSNTLNEKELKQKHPMTPIRVTSELDEWLSFYAYTNYETFVIGGQEIFEKALPLASKLYVTHIGKTFDVDTYFTWDEAEWTCISSERGEDTDLWFNVYERAVK